ncbi:MAG: class I SAM-dependent methyltransferase [bacterium]
MNTSKNNEKICILCGDIAHLTYKGMNGYVEGTKYDVYECINCLSSFVDPMSNLKEEYNIIYGGDNTKDAGYNYYYYLAKGVKSLKNPLKYLYNYCAIFWGVIKAINDSNIKKKAKILEVGSGLGYLTYSLNKAGYDCEGIDYSDTATNFANNFFGNKYFQGTIETFSENNEEKYDVVIATEVIEHIIDPNSFIKSTLKVLKSGGTLIFTTPIKDIHPKGTIWQTDYAPVHLWWFTEKGIEAVAKNNSTSVKFVDFTEYAKYKILNINLGIANIDPNNSSVVNKEGIFLHTRKKDYKEIIMKILPAWLYIKIVCFYHNLKFIQIKKNKIPDRYMYAMCAVISKV